MACLADRRLMSSSSDSVIKLLVWGLVGLSEKPFGKVVLSLILIGSWSDTISISLLRVSEVHRVLPLIG